MLEKPTGKQSCTTLGRLCHSGLEWSEGFYPNGHRLEGSDCILLLFFKFSPDPSVLLTSFYVAIVSVVRSHSSLLSLLSGR